MLKRFLFLLAILSSTNVHAEEILRGREARQVIPGAEVIRYREYSEIPVFIKFREDAQIDYSDWEEWMKERYFQNSKLAGFALHNEERDQLGMVHYRFKQTLDGNPLAFGGWIVHTLNGKVTSMNGRLYATPQPKTAALGEAAALGQALDYVGATTYMWEVQAEEQALQSIENDSLATHFPKGSLAYVTNDLYGSSESLKLTWKFNVYASEPMSRREMYIDAEDGSLVFENNLIHHVDSNSGAVTGYSGQRDIVSDYTGQYFRLRESGRGNGIFTYDMNNGTGGLGTDFIHSDHIWDTTTVERFGTDAHWGSEMTYDYFMNHYNRNSINNAGFALVSRVHYGTNYANAFWNGSVMTYGDGGSGNAPFTALDIAGHEIAHGLTTFTAGLIYEKESGALNESFSDIFGAAIEFDALGFANGDWLIGEDLGFIIRSMSNPNSQGDPDTYKGTNWHYSASDNYGVHTNSGVQNYWFYLLTVGGTGTNDLGNAFEVEGIGVDDAGAVAYRNLTTYLSQSSDYADARFYALESAIDLFGPCSQQLISTGNAWYAVGVGTPYEDDVTADFVPSSTGDCSVPLTVHFANVSSNATSQFWTFGDGGSTSQLNPSHTYTSAGTYTVTLAVASTCGTDTLVMADLIEIGPNAPCEVTMPSNGQFSSSDDCAGTLIDDGGTTQNYSDNNDSYFVISAQGAATITLTFNEFNVQPGGGNNCIYDFLEVYDGAGLNSPLIGRYCNSNPPPSTLTNTGDKLTIRFVSNGGVNWDGFRIAWECNAPTTPPMADFEADVVQTCDGVVHFTDLSQNGADSWMWDFGDGNSATTQNPTHTYAVNGDYTVELTTGNVIGNDTEIKTSYITVAFPDAPDGQDVQVCPGDQGTLIASGVGEMRWYRSSFGGDVIHVGDTFVTPIVQQSTAYYVESVVQSSAKTAGPVNNSFGQGGYLGSPASLYFDALSDLNLRSVRVYANTGGQRNFILKDNQGFVVADTTLSVPNGEQVVELDFQVEAGNDYELTLGANNAVNLYRNTTGVNFPYTLDGVARITSSSENGSYFYFYDWQVEEICISERAAIAASTGVCTGIDEIVNAEVSIYPNPSNGNFQVAWEGMGVHRIEVINLHGQVVAQRSVETGTESTSIDLIGQAAGVYLIELIGDDSRERRRMIVK